jgi:hypothetical protein
MQFCLINAKQPFERDTSHNFKNGRGVGFTHGHQSIPKRARDHGVLSLGLKKWFAQHFVIPLAGTGKKHGSRVATPTSKRQRQSSVKDKYEDKRGQNVLFLLHQFSNVTEPVVTFTSNTHGSQRSVVVPILHCSWRDA